MDTVLLLDNVNHQN